MAECSTIQIKKEIKTEPIDEDDDAFVVCDSNDSDQKPNGDLQPTVRVDVKCEMNNDLDTIIKMSESLRGKLQGKLQGITSAKIKPVEPEPAPIAEVKTEVTDNCIVVINKNPEIDDLLENEEGIYFECDICLMRFQSQFTLNTHKQVRHNSGEFRCDLCGVVCETSRKYIDHRLLHFAPSNKMKGTCQELHPNGSMMRWLISYNQELDQFECDTCFLKFEGIDSLASHKLTHLPDLSFSCRQCKQKFRTRQFRDHHVDNKHRHARFTCKVCHQVLSNKHNLARHMIYHSSKRYYQCATCCELFKRKCEIEDHVQATGH
ncbi:unnamed protein product [Bemisia tabaci]|uniref:C2H2-type domain-containing protein n=1 Tax=Bemisia tabaci TaxID=7038 RepID=A0A9P0A2M1_BEMTA|nr:unnamed protein product [Bemisia tabaci]